MHHGVRRKQKAGRMTLRREEKIEVLFRTSYPTIPFDCKQELQADGGGGNRERRSSHVDTNPPPKSDVLVECDYCDRKFAADRIQRHTEASIKSYS